MRYFKNYIIKKLGGYTEKEYIRLERKYQALLDSHTDTKTIEIANEYMYRLLQELDQYAKHVLYGLNTSEWCNKMYNVIHNNFFRIMIRYIHSGSGHLYKIDTTLDEANQFKKVLTDDGDEENLKKIENYIKNTNINIL